MHIFQHSSKGVTELEKTPDGPRRRRSMFSLSESTYLYPTKCTRPCHFPSTHCPSLHVLLGRAQLTLVLLTRNRALSIRSNRGSSGSGGGDGGGGVVGGVRKGLSFSSLRGSIQPELSRRLWRLIKSANNLISAHEAAGRERVAIATQLSEWGEQTGDEAVSDISDKVGVVLSEIGEQEENYAHALDDARARLKAIRNTERSVQPSRDSKARIADDIQRLRIREPQSTRLVVLEQELVRAEAENLVAEAQLTNIVRPLRTFSLSLSPFCDILPSLVYPAANQTPEPTDT